MLNIDREDHKCTEDLVSNATRPSHLSQLEVYFNIGDLEPFDKTRFALSTRGTCPCLAVFIKNFRS
jgi:hypothetical protein